jgi:hypothetical protein
VAFYKNDVRILHARTATASIVLPGRTDTSRKRLAPGAYRWYVWPVRNGKPEDVAVVRSTLVIPPR